MKPTIEILENTETLSSLSFIELRNKRLNSRNISNCNHDWRVHYSLAPIIYICVKCKSKTKD